MGTFLILVSGASGAIFNLRPLWEYPECVTACVSLCIVGVFCNVWLIGMMNVYVLNRLLRHFQPWFIIMNSTLRLGLALSPGSSNDRQLNGELVNRMYAVIAPIHIFQGCLMASVIDAFELPPLLKKIGLGVCSALLLVVLAYACEPVNWAGGTLLTASAEGKTVQITSGPIQRATLANILVWTFNSFVSSLTTGNSMALIRNVRLLPRCSEADLEAGSVDGCASAPGIDTGTCSLAESSVEPQPALLGKP